MAFASLDTKRIVVTGSSSGIGAAIAIECAAAGADVVVSCLRSREAAGAVMDAVRAHGARADLIPVDLADGDSCREFAQACFETGTVDGVVNNAGADLLTGTMKDAEYFEKLQTLLDVDIRGTIRLAKLFGDRLKEQGGGTLLTVGWDQSDRGMEGDSGELFAAAKNAVMGFTRSLALSLAPEVRVNCIAPGWIQTAWGTSAGAYWHQRVLQETPLKRWGTPEDVARTARFLLSEDASYITGQVINVNGGAVR